MTYLEKVKTARYLASVFLAYDKGGNIPDRPQDISWSFIFGMAKRHTLTVLFFEILKERIKAEAPENLYLDWSRECAIAGAKFISQKNAVREISKAFSENGIQHLFLKGFHIKKLYKSPEMREMTDIDVFVGREGINAASEILLSMGYALDLSLEVHDSFKKPPFLEIELHKILHLEACDYSMEETLPTAENPMERLMTDEDFVIFLLLHAKKHDEAGGAGMRSIFDFYLLFKDERYNNARVKERIEKEGLSEFYEKLLSLIDIWFYGGEESSALLEFEIYTVTGGTFGTLENKFMRQGQRKTKIGIIFSRIFPPYSAMARKHPTLKKCPLLLPYFYVYRFASSIFSGSMRRNVKALRGAEKNKKKIDGLMSDGD